MAAVRKLVLAILVVALMAGCSQATVETAVAKTTASGSGEAIVIDGDRSVTLVEATLVSASADRAVLFVHSEAGAGSLPTGTLNLTGGSLGTTGSLAPLFEVVADTTANINLDAVALGSVSGILLRVDANPAWAASGAAANLTASNQALTGDVEVDGTSSVAVDLTQSSVWSGALDRAETALYAAVTIDGTSRWALTGPSHVGTLTLAPGAVVSTGSSGLTYQTLVVGGTTVTTAGGTLASGAVYTAGQGILGSSR